PTPQRARPRLELGVEHRTASDLFPVVLLRLDPEERNRGSALLALGPARELKRADRLEQRIERSAEGAGLLAGDDRDRSRIGETPGGGAGRGGRAALLLLRPDDLGDADAIARLRLRAADGVAPRGA